MFGALADVMRPWDQRDDETSKAYRAFCVYLHLGPERSIRKAHREVTGNAATSPRWFEEWSRKHDWPERAAAFDTMLNQLTVQATADLTAQIVRRSKEVTLKAIDKVDLQLASVDEMGDLTKAINALTAAVQRLQPADQTPTVHNITVSFDDE